MSGLWTLDIYSMALQHYPEGRIVGDVAYLAEGLLRDLTEINPRVRVFETEVAALRECRNLILWDLYRLRKWMAAAPVTRALDAEIPEAPIPKGPAQDLRPQQESTYYYFSNRWEVLEYTGSVAPPWFYPEGKPRRIGPGVRGLYRTREDALKARLKALRYLKNTGKTNHPNYDLTEDL